MKKIKTKRGKKPIILPELTEDIKRNFDSWAQSNFGAEQIISRNILANLRIPLYWKITNCLQLWNEINRVCNTTCYSLELNRDLDSVRYIINLISMTKKLPHYFENFSKFNIAGTIATIDANNSRWIYNARILGS